MTVAGIAIALKEAEDADMPDSSSQRSMRLGISLQIKQRVSPNHTGPSPQRDPILAGRRSPAAACIC